MKKLMLLGGSKYLLPYIKKAQELGMYVITCDYLPDNIAHKYSDEYCNVSIIDKDKVLQEARRLEIDGILSPATDPGVVSAAYVAEQMGLNGVPYKSACILQDKGLFRQFLKDNDFNVPNAICSSTYKGILNKLNELDFPVIVKPVDSAGSKGVSRVDSINELKAAYDYAESYSINGNVIVEEFIEKACSTSGSEVFSVNNKCVFTSFDTQLFDKYAKNEYTPIGGIWPSSMDIEIQNELSSEIQRLVKLLNLGTSIYNVETRLGVDGKAYIMELSPRAGGNRLAEVLDYACDQHLVLNSILNAVGMEMLPMEHPVYTEVWSEYMIHSNLTGVLRNIEVDKEFEKQHIKEFDLWINLGDKVSEYTGADKAIGEVIMHFKDKDEANYYLNNVSEWLFLDVELVD